MTDTTGRPDWADARWRAEVDAWVVAICGDVDSGGAIRDDVDSGGAIRERPWSATIAYTGGSGPMWFKANGPGTLHEPPLQALLSRLVPEVVPEVLAIDTDRGWSLTRDAGPTLRSVPEGTLLTPWELLLPRYAEAQLSLIAHLHDLLDTGTADRRPHLLPTLLRDAVERLGRLAEDAGGVGVDRRRALEATFPAYERWCGELTAGGVPGSLQHDDLHAANMCWPGEAAQARIIDWGDASVMHPFATLLVTLGSIAHAGGLEVQDPEVRRLRDAYLEPFAAFGTAAELVRLVDLAMRTGVVARALSWEDALRGSGLEAHAAWDFPVREWLGDLVDGPPSS